MANGINDARTVVGGLSSGLAFSLGGGALTILPSAAPGVTGAQTAFGVNNSGETVGQFTDNNTGTTPGYVYHAGVYTILSPVANAEVTNAQGVNDNGLVTGFYSTDGLHQHGFFYNSATQTYTLPPDPNVPNLFLTQFLGLNDNGLAVGYYQGVDGSQHGFLFNLSSDTYTFLDDPFAATSGLSITQITGVNDSDEITGFYVDAQTGLQRGFIATLSVPEPTIWAMLLLGFAGLGFARYRARGAPISKA